MLELSVDNSSNAIKGTTMTIALNDALISISVNDAKAKAAAIAVCERIDAKCEMELQQKPTCNVLHLRCNDFESFLKELKFDFINWMLTAALLSIIDCVAMCKWIF